jgi:hypothetical protein
MPSLFSKLQFKQSDQILLVNAPDEFLPHLAELGDQVRVDQAPMDAETYDFALVFVKSCAEIAQQAAPVAARLNEDAGLWFAYPKKSSKRYKTDLGRDDGWQPLGDLGFEGVRQIAIDEDWSALRFRQAGKIKTMTRESSRAISTAGKERVTSP